MPPLQVSQRFNDVWGGDMIDTTPCLDIDRAEAGYELATMLGGICSPPLSVFEGDYGHFKTYPNVLNNFADFPTETQSEALFRELPNNGKRSPRSRLACAMARHGFLPNVIGLSQAECCTNSDLAEDQDLGTVFLSWGIWMIWAKITMTCGDILMVLVMKNRACGLDSYVIAH